MAMRVETHPLEAAYAALLTRTRGCRGGAPHPGQRSQ